MRSRHLLVFLSWLACTGCLHAGGIVFGQDPRSGGGIVPAPVGPIAESGSLHAGGVVFGQEPTREQWLELVLNQSGSLAGQRGSGLDGPEPVSSSASGNQVVSPFDALPAASTSIRVQVLDSRGFPLAGIQVDALRAVNGRSRLFSEVSDASGSVTLDLSLLQGSAKLARTGPDLFGFLPSPQDRIVLATESEPLVLFRDVAGSKFALLTAPWRRSSWTVRLGPPGDLAIETRGSVKAVGIVGLPYQASSFEADRWVLKGIPAGRYIVTALGQAGDLATTSVTVTPGETVQLPLLDVETVSDRGDSPGTIGGSNPGSDDTVHPGVVNPPEPKGVSG